MVKHGHSVGKTTPTYNSWAGMFQRCDNNLNAAYARYGARGISVCPQWYAFENFLQDMGPRPPGTSLDRIDVNDGYRPGNCRWATPKQQAENKTCNVLVSMNGETHPLSVWCDRLDVPYKLAHQRISQGWHPVDALLHPKLYDPREFLDIEITNLGVTQTVRDWIDQYGIKRKTAYTRVNSLGWTVERAVTTPPGKNGSSGPKNTKRGRRIHGIVIREVLMD